MKHENAKARSKGDIGGPDLPMNSSANHCGGMEKSMPDTDKGALETGYSAGGSIAGATKSSPGKGD